MLPPGKTLLTPSKLIIAPSNYPLFLPGVQILQALAAGNAVCAKPAIGYAEPLAKLLSIGSGQGSERLWSF